MKSWRRRKDKKKIPILPRSILNQLEDGSNEMEQDGEVKKQIKTPGTVTFTPKRERLEMSRKEIRKRERNAQKQQRIKVNTQKALVNKNKRKMPPPSTKQSAATNRPNKKQKTETPVSTKPNQKQELATKKKQELAKKKQEMKKKNPKLEQKITKPKDTETKPLTKEEKYLNKQLGLNSEKGNKKLVNELESEGLGDLFSMLDVPAPKAKKVSIKIQKHEEEDEEDEDEDDSDDENKMDEDGSTKEVVNKWSGNYYSTNDLYGKKIQEIEEEEEEEEAEEEEEEKEEIQKESTSTNSKYIPPSLRGKIESTKEEGTSTGSKYIPPSLRGKSTPQNRIDEMTKRKLRGQLNRISEGNLENICVQIIEIYNHSSITLTSEMLFALIFTDCEIPQKPSILMFYSILISILNRKVGQQIGGKFLETLIQKISSLLIVISDLHKKGNVESFNMLIFYNFCYFLNFLYHFNVAHSNLVFEVLNKISETFFITSEIKNDKIFDFELAEKGVEVILGILKTSGKALRTDSPQFLKTFIENLRKTFTDKFLAENTDKKRIQFFLEYIFDLKNNKISGNNQNVEATQLATFKTTFKGSLSKRQSDQITANYEDLLSGKSRFWLPGSHVGTEIVEGKLGSTKKGQDNEEEKEELGFSAEVLALAKEHRMTNDIAQTVFCILLSSSDYLDAFEKLLGLNLKNTQDREIVNVIIYLVETEQKFNMFYGYLSKKFCDWNWNYKITFQYKVWDRLRNLESMENLRSLRNFAKYLSFLISEFCVSITVLKIVDFMALIKSSKKERLFWDFFWKLMFDDNTEETITAIFERTLKNRELDLMKEQMWFVWKGMRSKNRKKLAQLEASGAVMVGEDNETEVGKLKRWNRITKRLGRVLVESVEMRTL